MGMPMRKSICVIILVTIGVLSIFSATSLAQQKLAQTGMKFLNVGMNARITAMGEAFTAVEGSSSSMYYNPACMARLNSLFDFSFGQTRWIADINYNSADLAFSPSQGDYGVFGFTLMFVDYGNLKETIRANNEDGYLLLGTFRPTSSVIGLGYANALSDRFSIGANVKYVTQNLGSATTLLDMQGNPIKTKSSTNVMAFDFGMLYRTGFKSLNFGAIVRNFSKEVKYEKEGFLLPLIFKIGLSINAMDFLPENKEMHSFTLSVDATHPRDYPEQVNVGAEYMFMKVLSVRAGYMANNDEFGFTRGVGVQKEFNDVVLSFDYSNIPFDRFKEVDRISFQLTMLH